MTAPDPGYTSTDEAAAASALAHAASGAREAMETLSVLVEEARAGGAHAAMGFASWTDYLSSTLGASPMRLDREQRAAGAHHGRGVPVSDPQVHESIDGQPVGGAFALLSGATRPSECRSTSIAPTPRSPGHSPSGERGVRAPGVPAPCRTQQSERPAATDQSPRDRSTQPKG